MPSRWERLMVAMGDATNVPIIGKLVGVTHRRSEISWEDYKKLVKKYGIPEDECVEKLTPEMALRLTVMEKKKSVHTFVEGYDGECIVFCTVRAGRNKKEIFLAKEVSGKKTGEKATSLGVDKDLTYRVWLTDSGVLNLASIEDGSVDQTLLTELRQRFAVLKESVPAAVLVSKIKSLMKDEWRGIPYTLSRSLYFVPVAYMDNVEKHKQLVEEFAEMCNKYERYRTQIRDIPCIDSDEQRDYVAADVQKEIEKELRDAIKGIANTVETMVKKVTESASGGKEINADDLRATMTKLVERQERLKEKVETINNNYSELLNKEIIINVQDVVSREDVVEIKSRFDAIGEEIGAEASNDFYHTALNLMGLNENSVNNLNSRFDMLDLNEDNNNEE